MRASELQKELRIGNYLLGKCVDELDERKEWWEQYQIKDAEDLMGVKDGWDEPIPLTEKWLLKFSFTKKLGNWELPNFRFHINKPMNYDGFVFCDGYSVISDKIHYVHELQNLYFALTKTELKLKP